MIVFQKQIRPDEETKLVVLFGAGLIGASVCKSINRQADFFSFYLPFAWDSPEQRRKDTIGIFDYLSSTLLKSCATLLPSQIAFVWSAGKSGFAASQKDMDGELGSFDIVLDLVRRIQDSFPSVTIIFHLLSSAGGLFEGQRLIHSASTPQPKRYYGQLKYEQEKRLLKLKGRVIRKVYRPTSVYGFVGSHQRMGLIPTLVSNGIKNKVSTIFGDLSTLRDYVFNDDVGEYVGKNLFLDSCSSGDTSYHLLGSGKPSSIYEIRYFVEQVVGKRIYLEFYSTPETENTTDITVSSSALPAAWAPVEVKSGIRYVKEKLLRDTVATVCESDSNQVTVPG